MKKYVMQNFPYADANSTRIHPVDPRGPFCSASIDHSWKTLPNSSIFKQKIKNWEVKWNQ